MCDLHSILLPVANWAKTAIMKVPHAVLRAIAFQNPAVAATFWRDTMVDAGVLAKWVANLGRKNSRARFAHLLCEIGFRMDDRWLMMRLRPYRTVEDRIEGIVLSFVDITQRRHAEDALRHSDERYRSMLGGILRRLLDRQPAVRPDGYLKIKVPAQHAYCSATKAGCK